MRRDIALGIPAVLAAVVLAVGGAPPSTSAAAARGHHLPAPRADDGAHVVAERWVAPRQLDVTIASPALAGEATVRLLTPDGWRPGRHGAWPTLYLLHGCCGGSHVDWTTRTDVAQTRALRRTLVVMPDGGTAGWYSDWWNRGAGGAPAWERFHLTEMRQILERGYGAGERRVIAGLSMGGFGALSYAARHPGLFGAVASYSGVAHPLYEPGGPENVQEITEGQGLDPDDLWGDPQAQRAIWAAHDPYALAERLRRTPVFIAAGDGNPGPLDPPGTAFSDIEALLGAESHATADRLRALHAPVTTDFYGPGTHSWPYWERELHRSLPVLLRGLRR